MTYRVVVVVVVAAVVATAAVAAALGGGVTDRSLPELDRSRALVPLGEVHFDLFDGTTLPLTAAPQRTRESLRDRIPPIERPRYVRAGRADHLADDDLVLGYVTDAGRAYAYPIRILNFHEIVNEVIEGTPLVVTYCPLCRSGVVYDRRLDGRELTFGNTSALYDNDMVMYDHQTNSYWWHTPGRAIVGELAGAELTPLPSSMAHWGDWRRQHPGTRVLSTDTGFDRDYTRDPYDGYRQIVNAGHRFFDDAEASVYDDRLDDGDEVVGVVIGDEARAYAVRRIGDAAVNDVVGERPVVVFSRAQGPTGTVFDRRVDGEELTFEASDGAYRDRQTGSTWGPDGVAVDGPLDGERLEPVASRSTMWFSFAAAFDDVEVVDEPG